MGGKIVVWGTTIVPSDEYPIDPGEGPLKKALGKDNAEKLLALLF